MPTIRADASRQASRSGRSRANCGRSRNCLPRLSDRGAVSLTSSDQIGKRTFHATKGGDENKTNPASIPSAALKTR